MITTAYDGTLKFDTQIDTNGFKAGTNTIKAQANGLKSILSGLAKAMLAAFSIAALISFGKQAIETASDLQEVQNVVDTAFGEMAYKIEDFAKTSIENFGLSKLAAKQMASTYMAISTGMGQMAGQASDMAVEITGRLGDIMSFYNKTQSEVDTMGKAIYTGETEPLKAIGVIATETNLALFALQKGFKTAYSEMAADEKLLVRQMYFLDKTSIAAGDFVKTSDSWANQTRVLSERWKEFMGILGNGLIQVLTPVVKYLNTAMTYLIQFANTASKVLSSVFNLSNATADTAKNTAAIATGSIDASDGLADMGASAKKAAKDAKGSEAGFDKLNNITDTIASNSESASAAMSSMNTGVGLGITPTVEAADTSKLEKSLTGLAEKIKKSLEPIFNLLNRLKDATAPFAKNIGSGLKWFFDNVLLPLGGWTVTELIPTFLDTLGAAIGVLNAILIAFQPLGIWLWETFLQPLAAWTGDSIINGLDSLTTGLNKLSTWIIDNQELVRNAALVIAGFFAAFKIAQLITAIAPFISTLAGLISSGTLLSTILSGISTVLGTIASPIGIAVAAIGLLIYSFVDLYKNSEDFRQSLANMHETWMTSLQPFADFISNTLASAWNDILKPIIAFFIDTLLPNLIDTFKNLWQNVLVPLGTFLGTVLQPVFQVITDLLSMLWENVILPLANAIGGVLKKAWDGLYEILNKTIIPIIKKVIEVLTFLWEKVINPIVKVLWDVLKPAFETVFKAIGDIFGGLGKTLGGVIDFITGVFTGNWTKAWEGIKSIFTGIWDAIWGVLKGVINLIIGLLNGLIGGITTGINAVIWALNKINFTVPEWVPLLGGKSFGFNLKELTAPKIPMLATGTVVPANYGNFLAMLGDNRREPEVVSPLSTMKQALKEAMAEMGGGGSGELTVNVYLSGKQIHSEVVKQDKEYQAQTGHSAFSPA